MTVSITFPTFPIFSNSIMTMKAQELALDEWVEEQDIITIESWGIKNNTHIRLVPAFPEQIQHDTELRLQNSFYDFLNS